MSFEIVRAPGGTPVSRHVAPGARGEVLLLCDLDGVEALRPFSEALVAAGGWSVSMPHPWWRLGSGAPSTRAAAAAAEAERPDHEALADVVAVRRLWTPGLPGFVVGFGMGGLTARLAACTQVGLAGVVEFYGRVVHPVITTARPAQPLDLLPGLGCPIQGHFGTADRTVPEAHVDELERRLRLRPVPSQVFRYAGAGHGFMTEPPPGEDGAARVRTAWGRVDNFFEQLLPRAAPVEPTRRRG